MKIKQLKSLAMENFKCFSRLEIQFGKLNVLTGFNGTGKSSAIQPILLLAQTLNSLPKNASDRGKFWPIIGEFVNLGMPGEVLKDDSPKKEIKFEYGFTDSSNLSCRLKINLKNRNFSGNKISNEYLESLNSISNLCYIGAMRNSTSKLNPRPDIIENSNAIVGSDGRFASYLFDKNSGKKNFSSKVNGWLNKIREGSQAQVIALSDFTIFELKFKQSITSGWHSPANVGFGLSYAFPVIVAAVSSRNGDILIVDSPEAHLHPSAQTIMGKMLAETAARGVQVIVETHSDHVLNGIRLAVKSNTLKPRELRIMFFNGSEQDFHGVLFPRIDQNGKLDEWPSGFFDQIEIDTLELIGD